MTTDRLNSPEPPEVPSVTAPGSAVRRVLAVAYAFPPAAPIGTMRTLRLVKRLEAEGWATTVLTVTPDSYPPDMPFDAELLSRVPTNVEVISARVFRPLAKVSGTLRRDPASKRTHASFRPVPTGGSAAPSLSLRPSLVRRVYTTLDELTSIPDKEIGWLAPAVAKGLLSIIRRRPAVLYSSAPPWSGQLVALALARISGLPWVADFRDPWARAPWRETQAARIRRAAVTLERRVVNRADAILFATRTNRDEYAAHYGPDLARKFQVVCNGCDPQEFVDLKGAESSGRFVLLHAGSLYGARTPVPLFSAIALALQSGAISREHFCFRLIGSTNADFPLAASALGLDGVVEFLPRMPRQKILNEMASASCLVVLQPGTTVSVPGKLYEYLAVGRPILALSEEGETSDLVRESGIGIAVAPQDEAAIEAALRHLVASQQCRVQRPPPRLYDGNVTAGEAVAIIDRVAQARSALRPRVDATVNIRNS